MKWCWVLANKCFLCICWNGYVVFVFHFIGVAYYLVFWMLDLPYAAGVSLFSSDISMISVIFLSDLKVIMIALKNEFRSVPSLTFFWNNLNRISMKSFKRFGRIHQWNHLIWEFSVLGDLNSWLNSFIMGWDFLFILESV